MIPVPRIVPLFTMEVMLLTDGRVKVAGDGVGHFDNAAIHQTIGGRVADNHRPIVPAPGFAFINDDRAVEGEAS